MKGMLEKTEYHFIVIAKCLKKKQDLVLAHTSQVGIVSFSRKDMSESNFSPIITERYGKLMIERI